MKLKKVTIENFRSIKEQTIEIDDYNCLVGPNGAGKSTVLNALNVFFRNNKEANTDISTLTEEDFHYKNTDEPIRIYLEFTDLSEEAKQDFKAYYRNESLHIYAEALWNENSQKAKIKHYGQREVIDDFAIYFRKDKNDAYASELKETYQNIRSEYSNLPDVSVKADMKNALREYEETHPEQCSLKPSEDQFYGVSRGANKLEKYVQWVYVPAVKDPSSEEEEASKTALGQLLDRTIREKVDFEDPIQELKNELAQKYQDLLDEESDVLEDISNSLEQRLHDWAHAGTKLELGWHYDSDKSVRIKEPNAKVRLGEDNFVGEIARSGHGLQRSFIISLLQELAEGKEDESPTLLLGFEEPELYQHPPQARHIQNVLEGLSKSNSQILLTTHSPYFVSSKGFENIRRFSKNNGEGTEIKSSSIQKINELIANSLGDDPRTNTSFMAAMEQIMQPSQNELFFSKVAILVEGQEDVAYLTAELLKKDLWKKFRKLGCHFVIGAGKSKMSRPLAIAKELEIPIFLMFDADTDKKGNQKKDNRCLLGISENDSINPLPEENIFENNVIVWRTNIGDEVKMEYGSKDKWNQYYDSIKQERAIEDITKKNWYRISTMLEELSDEGWNSELLNKSVNSILEFAEGVNS